MDVIERTSVWKILQNKKLQLTGQASTECAIEIVVNC